MLAIEIENNLKKRDLLTWPFPRQFIEKNIIKKEVILWNEDLSKNNLDDFFHNEIDDTGRANGRVLFHRISVFLSEDKYGCERIEDKACLFLRLTNASR